MGNVLKRVGQVDEAQLQRREAQANGTYLTFLKSLCGNGALSEEFAERAAVAVLNALEQRIDPEEAHHLEAQLPVKLVKLLYSAGPIVTPVAGSAKDQFLAHIADALGLGTGEVESVVRRVFAAIRNLVSDGECEDIAAQLPPDLAALWAEAA